jgi:hypothetical protein
MDNHLHDFSSPSESNSEDRSSQNNLEGRSSLYAEFLAERQEILRHKWIESEKAGMDIGFEKALLDWTRHHRADWRVKRRIEQDSQRSKAQK